MKQRFIDADELKKEFPHDEDWDYPVNSNGYVVETINRMPTVDVIPVEWIKNIINEIDKSICNLELETKYDYQVLAHALERRTALVGLIRYWKKENESNSNS